MQYNNALRLSICTNFKSMQTIFKIHIKTQFLAIFPHIRAYVLIHKVTLQTYRHQHFCATLSAIYINLKHWFYITVKEYQHFIICKNYDILCSPISLQLQWNMLKTNLWGHLVFTIWKANSAKSHFDLCLIQHTGFCVGKVS